jgi:DNA-binding protein H-NS
MMGAHLAHARVRWEVSAGITAEQGKLAQHPEKEKDAAIERHEAKRKSKVAVKYRDGENTWTGRGRPPRWLAAKIAAGARREDYAVR